MRFYSSLLRFTKCWLELCGATLLCHLISESLCLPSVCTLWLREQGFKVSLVEGAQTRNSYPTGWKQGGMSFSAWYIKQSFQEAVHQVLLLNSFTWPDLRQAHTHMGLLSYF